MNTAQVKKEIWDLYPNAAERIRRETHPNTLKELQKIHDRGDWIHAHRVGRCAYHFALDQWGNEGLARDVGLSGLFHNIGKILRKKYGSQFSRGVMKSFLNEALQWERREDHIDIVSKIIYLIQGHKEENKDDDSKELIALKDANRFVNLSLERIMFSARRYPEIPVINYDVMFDPRSTYQYPRSVLEHVTFALEWVNPESPYCIRTQLAQKEAQPRADKLRSFASDLRDQIAEEGMHPK